MFFTCANSHFALVDGLQLGISPLFLPNDPVQNEDSLKVDLPMMSLCAIRDSTGHFSNEAKLGEGGFGPVYKVKH